VGGRYVVRTPRNVLAGTVGMHQGARAGSSLEFKEHRDYEPGDDLRHIDWNAFARSDHLMVKLFHEEVTPHVDIILDDSRSMALEGSGKDRAALGLAACFAAAAENAGFSHRVWLVHEGCTQLFGSTGRSATWTLPAFDFRGSVGESFARRPPALRPRGLRLFISDLFWLGDPMQVLAPCAERASSLVVLQVLARADVDPIERGNLRLIDSETDQVIELLVDGPSAERYRKAFQRHQKNWHDSCRRAGAFMTALVAEDLLREWRLDDLVAAEILQVM